MLKKIKDLIKPKVDTLNTITIHKNCIKNNLNIIRKLQPNNAFFPVLKSNAYWHGILQVLEILKDNDFPYLVVDSFPEYQIIHNNSKFNILIMGETLPENYNFFDYRRTTVAIYNIDTLKYLISLNKKIKIHLFINTWMNREGIQKKDINSFLKILKKSKKITLEWVMSHLYDADEIRDNHIDNQIKIFKEMIEIIEENWFSPKWKHIWASAWMTTINDPFFNARRPWILLYWYSPFPSPVKKLENLSPALSLTSSIISLQEIDKNDGVSYNHRRISEKKCRSATIPFWYYEGWMRTLSWKLTYYYNNIPTPQIWTICMNISSTLALPQMKCWEKIELISNDIKKENSIVSIAEKANTIPYEILIRLDKWIRRILW